MGLFIIREVFTVTTNLSRFIKEERVKQRLNYAELSRRMGYKNLNKGMRRVIDLEREGIVHSEVLEKISDALNLDREHVNALINKDRQEQEEAFEKWVSEPIQPHYILRIIPTIYQSYDLPGNFPTEDRIIEYVAGVAKEKHKQALLCLSRREKISINEKGEIMGKIKTTMENVHYPYTRIK